MIEMYEAPGSTKPADELRVKQATALWSCVLPPKDCVISEPAVATT
jgi:hypothetical protein